MRQRLHNRRPVVLIGLDAAEWTLIEKGCAEGRLPALASLLKRGCRGRLDGEADVFSGGVWPTFYTGRRVPSHGIYHHKLWRAERMRFEPPDESWLPEKPFWETLNADRVRAAVVDVPMVARRPRPLNGVYVSGWGSHDLIAEGAWPPGLWKELARNFGRPRMPPEPEGPQNGRRLLELRQRLLDSTAQMTRLTAALMAREPWDLFLAVFGATHRAGHYLWDLSKSDLSQLDRDGLDRLGHALSDVYEACDRAVSALVERAPRDARILIFALHGMGPNSGWADRCPDLLARIGQRGPAAPSAPGLAYRLKNMVPNDLARRLLARVPRALYDPLLSLYWSSARDWTQTRYFPMAMDHAGYVRINMVGREPKGVVRSGEEYTRICAELEEGLLSFRDLVTGAPIVDHVCFPWRDNAGARYRDVLPDVLAVWKEVAAPRPEGARSEAWGEVRWTAPPPSSRTGNHRRYGWFLAAGEGIPVDAQGGSHHILDLLPTLCRWLGVEPAAELQGRSIDVLCS